jgi:hypothetical protein
MRLFRFHSAANFFVGEQFQVSAEFGVKVLVGATISE